MGTDRGLRSVSGISDLRAKSHPSCVSLANARLRKRSPRETSAKRNNRPGVKGQENQSRSKDRYLSDCQRLKSLQTKQMTAGEASSRWSYTFVNTYRVPLRTAATRANAPAMAFFGPNLPNKRQTAVFASIYLAINSVLSYS